jgi:hypothetical protein
MSFYRSSKKLKTYPVIYIYTNAETEYNYFYSKKMELHGIRTVRIKTPLEKVGNPKQLINIAKEQCEAPITKKDRIFCIIDVDNATNEEIQSALKIKPKYIDLIISNPNFELWLLLHFNYYSHQFSIGETLEKLKMYLPDYKKPNIQPIFHKLKETEEIAIKNSKKLESHHLSRNTDLYSKNANPYTFINNVVELLNSFQNENETN